MAQAVTERFMATRCRTIELCATVQPEGLPAERLFEEWKKLIVKGVKPSMGLNFLKECGWVRYYPELSAMIGCQQEPDWHPEGDVWVHTLHCMDAFAREKLANMTHPLPPPSGRGVITGAAPQTAAGMGNSASVAKGGTGAQPLNKIPSRGEGEGGGRNNEWEDLIVGLAVLLHDVGKPATTQFIDGRWRSRGHDIVGVPIAEKFLRRLTGEAAIFDEVLPLVECHMRPLDLYKSQAGDGAIRRLACKVGRIDRLVRVARADMMGRPPMTYEFPEGPWLLERDRALEIEAQAPKPLVQGRHLIALGYKPSPEFKKILEAAYEAQLEGAFKDLPGGEEWLKEYLKQNKIEQ